MISCSHHQRNPKTLTALPSEGGERELNQRLGKCEGRSAHMKKVVTRFRPRDAERRPIVSKRAGWSPPRCLGSDSRYRSVAPPRPLDRLGGRISAEGNAQNAAGAVKLPPLARYFPSQDLVAYVEFDGLEGHREGWQKTAAYRLLSETTTGEMYRAALSRIFAALLREQASASIDFNGRELTDLVLHLFRRGFAVGINRAGGTGPPRCFGIVIRDGAKGEIRPLVERMLRADAGPRSKVQDLQKAGGRTIHQLGDSGGRSVQWWCEGDDLVVCVVSAEGTLAVIDALDGRVPSAVAHAARQALFRAAMRRGSSRWSWLSSTWRRCRLCPRKRSAWGSTASSDSSIAGVFTAMRFSRS